MAVQILIPQTTSSATSPLFSSNDNNTCSITALGLSTGETVEIQVAQRVSPTDKTAGINYKTIITLTPDVPYTDNFNSNLTLRAVKSATVNPVWVQITSINGFSQLDNVE